MRNFHRQSYLSRLSDQLAGRPVVQFKDPGFPPIRKRPAVAQPKPIDPKDDPLNNPTPEMLKDFDELDRRGAAGC